MTDLRTLYQTDFAAWAKRHVELLRARRFAEMDIEHLLEELSDMSKSERRELESRLLILIAHLLKWEFQYQKLSERWREFDGRSWRATIVEQRKQLAVLLRQSPGLQSVLGETILATFPDAVDLASKETRMPPETYPARCPYTAEQVLNDDFYPVSTETRQDDD
jgi:transposase